MIEFIYAVGQTVFGILMVLVAVVVTLALGFGILAGLGADWPTDLGIFYGCMGGATSKMIIDCPGVVPLLTQPWDFRPSDPPKKTERQSSEGNLIIRRFTIRRFNVPGDGKKVCWMK